MVCALNVVFSLCEVVDLVDERGVGEGFVAEGEYAAGDLDGEPGRVGLETRIGEPGEAWQAPRREAARQHVAAEADDRAWISTLARALSTDERDAMAAAVLASRRA